MDSRSLLNNKFIDTNVYSIRQQPEKYLDDQAKFRQFMEKKQINTGRINFQTSGQQLGNVVEQSENIIDLLESNKTLINGGVNNVLSGQDYLRNNSIRYNTDNNSGDASLAVMLQAQQAKPENRFVQERRRYVAIDTRDRDLTLYPDQNDYRISLGKEVFTNVVSVKMKGTEFTNTQQLIKSTPLSQKNNVIQWNIEGDIDAGLEDIIYTATINPGNYTETTLATEIETQMNSVVRENGQLNNFTVTIDSVTDTVTFTEIEFSTVSDPFDFSIPPTTQNFTPIETTLTGHGLIVGDRVFIENAVGADGISSALLNQEHIVTEIISIDVFSFNVPVQATSNESNIGGPSVRIGTGVAFQLLWSIDNTFGDILGFDPVDTGFAFTHQNTQEIAVRTDLGTGSVEDNRLKINKIDSGDSANVSEIRTTLPHLLNTGDRIFIFSVATNPSTSTVIEYDHLYGVAEGSLTTDENNNRLAFVALLADPAGLIVTVIDDNTFTAPIPFVVVSASITAAIAAVDDDDEQGDLILKQINAAIDLSGEKYIYMTSSAIGGDMVSTSDNIENVFAKIQLAGQADANIFNAWIGGIKVFYDVPKDFLDEIDVQFVTQDGVAFEFNDKNHSYVLEITEGIQKLEGTGFSGRIGART